MSDVRRKDDRRKVSIPVKIDRRGGKDRRSEPERRRNDDRRNCPI